MRHNRTRRMIPSPVLNQWPSLLLGNKLAVFLVIATVHYWADLSPLESLLAISFRNGEP